MKFTYLLFALIFSITSFAQSEIISVGATVPDFKIIMENGEVVPSNSLKGKVIFINFFATWCVPCMAELPVLQTKVWDKYKTNTNFTMLVIGREHSDSVVQAFKAKYNFTLPFYPDKTRAIYNQFTTKYIPRNYIIDKAGKVVYSSIGYEKEEFDKMLLTLEKLLK